MPRILRYTRTQQPTRRWCNERPPSPARSKTSPPTALIFGPVNYGWQGFIRLQDAPDANNRDFQEFYLQQMQQASNAAGKRLLDVMDVHWYPEAHGTNNIRITEQDNSAATVAARLQAPRSLWDPTYTESSWITQWSTNGPIKLLPRLQTKINNNFPGTKLAITEYNYGGGNHISGGDRAGGCAGNLRARRCLRRQRMAVERQRIVHRRRVQDVPQLRRREQHVRQRLDRRDDRQRGQQFRLCKLRSVESECDDRRRDQQNRRQR